MLLSERDLMNRFHYLEVHTRANKYITRKYFELIGENPNSDAEALVFTIYKDKISFIYRDFSWGTYRKEVKVKSLTFEDIINIIRNSKLEEGTRVIISFSIESFSRDCLKKIQRLYPNIGECLRLECDIRAGGVRCLFFDFEKLSLWGPSNITKKEFKDSILKLLTEICSGVYDSDTLTIS